MTLNRILQGELLLTLLLLIVVPALPAAAKSPAREVVIALPWGEPESTSTAAALAPLQEKGISVRIENAGGAGLQAKIAANKVDLVMQNQLALYTLEKHRLLEDLDAVMAHYNIDWTDFWPACREEFTSGSKTFALPLFVDPHVMVYNKCRFNDAGLAYPEALTKPYDWKWTWQAFKEYTIRLTCDIDGDGDPDLYGFNWMEDMLAFYLIEQNGGELFAPDMRRCTIAGPAAEGALAFMAELIRDLKVWPLYRGNYVTDFRNGGSAMTIGTGFEFLYYRDLMFHPGIVRVFRKLNSKRFIFASSTGIALVKNAPHKEEACEVMSFMVGEEYQRKRGGLMPVHVPARVELARSNEFVYGLGINIHPLVIAAEESTGWPELLRLPPAIFTVFGEELKSLWFGQDQPADVLRRIEGRVNELLQ